MPRLLQLDDRFCLKSGGWKAFLIFFSVADACFFFHFSAAQHESGGGKKKHNFKGSAHMFDLSVY